MRFKEEREEGRQGTHEGHTAAAVAGELDGVKVNTWSGSSGILPEPMGELCEVLAGESRLVLGILAFSTDACLLSPFTLPPLKLSQLSGFILIIRIQPRKGTLTSAVLGGRQGAGSQAAHSPSCGTGRS